MRTVVRLYSLKRFAVNTLYYTTLHYTMQCHAMPSYKVKIQLGDSVANATSSNEK